MIEEREMEDGNKAGFKKKKIFRIMSSDVP